MSPFTKPSPTTPTPAEARAPRQWPWILGMLLVAAWIAYVVIAGRADNVLAEATLPDGTILRLEQVTFGDKQTLIVQRGSPPLTIRLGFGQPELSASAEFGDLFPQSGVWLTRRDPETGEPLDLDWFSHCTTIDADGWEFTSGFAGRCHWSKKTAITPNQETLFRDPAPFKPLPPRAYQEIVVGAFLPQFRPKDGRFPLNVYNTQGEVVATFDAPYPGPPPVRQNWSPVTLPATESSGDLTVTLERVDCTPLPVDATIPEKRLPTLRLEPQVKFKWQGEDSDDWRFVSENIVAVEDGLGNMSYLDRCRLTPHVPAWKLGFLILRKSDARYEAHEQWDSGPIELPPAGEFRDLALQGEVAMKDGATLPVQVMKVFGPGTHQFTIVDPLVLGRITPPLEQTGAGWKVSAVHRVGNVDWTVESQQPFVIWRQKRPLPGQMQQVFSRCFDGDAQIGVDDVYDYSYGDNTIVTILKSSPAHDAIHFKPAMSDMRNVYFFISPPQEAMTTGETASEVQREL